MSDCTHDCSSCGESCGGAHRAPGLPRPGQRPVPHREGHRRGQRQGRRGQEPGHLLSGGGHAPHGQDGGRPGRRHHRPSIPAAFGVHTKAEGSELGIYPAETKTGIEIMSLNLLTENETDPVVWRGPVIAGAVKQFWTDVIWGDVDYLFVDMPPEPATCP